MVNRWQNVDIVNIIPEIIQSQADILIVKEKYRLYNQSLLATGEKLALYQDIKYAIKKEQLNPTPGFLHPDLFLTGDFYKGFTVQVKAKQIYFTSTDIKTDELVLNYTQYIFGLTEKQKTEYALNEFYEALKTYITTQTGISFR
jgi:hypothetical protein